LDSLTAQECDDWELVIVDDGSSDGTLTIANAYAETHPGRVRVLQQDHGGCAAARNRGADVATGEYLAFLDSDDLWFPWTLRVLAEQIETKGRPAIVAIELFSFSNPDEVSRVTEDDLQVVTGEDFFEGALRSGFALGVAHTVCKREAYQKVGGCPELDINATDSDVLLKMGVEPGFARVLHPPLLAYRQHEGATTVNPVKGHAGAQMLMRHEREGVYPGGKPRRRERLEQILIRVRAVSLLCAKAGRGDLAWDLYRTAFRWNLRCGRLRYLLGFPPMALLATLRGPRSFYDS
ncbi:MAG: glycosyltransferase family A protein, partial [Planctomycetota bacterium]